MLEKVNQVGINNHYIAQYNELNRQNGVLAHKIHSNYKVVKKKQKKKRVILDERLGNP